MPGLIDDILALVDSNNLSSLASQLNETEDAVSKGLSGIASTLLGGLLRRSSNENVFGEVFRLLNNRANLSFLDNPAGLIADGSFARGKPKDAASGLMGKLFGANAKSILHKVDADAGLKKETSSKLLGFIGPLLMGYLSQQISTKRMSTGDLRSMLTDEKANIVAALPSGVGSDIGLVAKSSGKAKAGKKKGPNNFIPIIVTIAAFTALVFLLRTCDFSAQPQQKVVEKPRKQIEKKNAPSQSASRSEDEEDDAATNEPASVMAAKSKPKNKPKTTLKDVSAAVKSASGFSRGYSHTLPNGESIEIFNNGIEQQLIAFIDDESVSVDSTTWFDFDRLNFATGSAMLNVAASRKQLDNMAKIIQAYPELTLKIGGYTDNTGDPEANMQLSDARAEAVKKALLKRGIERRRLAFEGYGSKHPIASNETEEGRALNRRIAVRVTTK